MGEYKEEFKLLGEGFFVFLKWLLFSIMIGFIVGLAGVFFHFCIELATQQRIKQDWILFLLPIGGIFIGWIYKICGMSNHPGTNVVLSAVRDNEKLTLKTAPLIFVSTVVTHLFGGSSGREGAALQLGGSISNKIGRMMHLDEKDARIITMCGMSAAFSALFGTPIAAIFFSMEVVSVGVMYYSAIVPCAIASMVGHGIALFFGVAPTKFTVLGIPHLNITSSFQVICLAVECAFISVLFCMILEKAGNFYRRKFPNTLIRPFVGGLIVIGATLIVGCRDYNGAGIDIITQAFYTQAKPEAFLLKILFTAFTLGAGFKGGEIVPAFFTGAMFGNVAGSFIGLHSSFGAGIGMLTVFCGVTNCPLTAILLGIEMFGSEGLIYFAVACSISYLLSGYYGLYREQKIVYSKFRPEFINHNTH